MAMMSHTCLSCGAVYHDNDYSPGKCVCGGMHFRSDHDEDYKGGNIYDSEEE